MMANGGRSGSQEDWLKKQGAFHWERRCGTNTSIFIYINNWHMGGHSRVLDLVSK